MNKINSDYNFLLKLKHWQLFFFLLGIPLLLELIGIILIHPTNIYDVLNINLYLMPIIISVIMLFLFRWFWSVGIILYKKISFDMNLKRFKAALLFSFTYMILFLFFILSVFLAFVNRKEGFPSIVNIIILALYLFSILCLIYVVHFISKLLIGMKLGRRPFIKEYVGCFFLLLFFPVGIWFIQPKINGLTR